MLNFDIDKFRIVIRPKRIKIAEAILWIFKSHDVVSDNPNNL